MPFMKPAAWLLNDELKKVTVDGEEVKLTPIEYNILLLLMKNKGKVFSISQIYEEIWNEEAIGADNTVAVHIRHIREKIEINPKEPRYLKVVWGSGYKIGAGASCLEKCLQRKKGPAALTSLCSQNWSAAFRTAL